MPQRTPKQVLVVEDDPSSREALAKLMQLKRVKVAQASTVEAALTCLRECKPDVILVDMMLPDGSGEAVVKANAESDRPVPVIVMTGSGDDALRGRLASYDGPVLVLTKPLNFATLFDQLGM